MIKFNDQSFPKYKQLPYFVRLGLEFLKDKTETPSEYLVAILLSCMSVVCGPWYQINQGYLNQYILLIGSSGSRKSTAIKFMQKILQRVKLRRKNLNIVTPGQRENEEVWFRAISEVTNFSVEGLQQHCLQTGTSTAIVSQEFAQVLQLGRRQSQGNTIPALTDFYDGYQYSSALVSRGAKSTENFAVSILGASTAAWAQDMISSENIGGGFFNRFLLFTGTRQEPIPDPLGLSEQELDQLADLLNNMIPSDLRFDSESKSWIFTTKQVSLSFEAKELWDAYYRLERVSEDDMPDSWHDLTARERTHAIKLAAQCAVGEQRLEINCDDLCFGVDMAGWCRSQSLEFASRKNLDVPPSLILLSSKILRKIEHCYPMTKTEICKHFGGKQDLINRSLEAMVSANNLSVDDSGYSPHPTSDSIDKKRCSIKSTIWNLREAIEGSRESGGDAIEGKNRCI